MHAREVQVEFVEKRVACSVRVGNLDPIDEPTGYRRRLEHLAFRKPPAGSETEAEAEALDGQAIRAFQKAESIEVTGALDAATRAVLLAAHGS